jgi:hypothetical protein
VCILHERVDEAHVHAYVGACLCVYGMHTCECVCVRACVGLHVGAMCVCVFVLSRVRACVSGVCVCVCVCMHVCVKVFCRCGCINFALKRWRAGTQLDEPWQPKPCAKAALRLKEHPHFARHSASGRIALTLAGRSSYVRPVKMARLMYLKARRRMEGRRGWVDTARQNTAIAARVATAALCPRRAAIEANYRGACRQRHSLFKCHWGQSSVQRV